MALPAKTVKSVEERARILTTLRDIGVRSLCIVPALPTEEFPRLNHTLVGVALYSEVTVNRTEVTFVDRFTGRPKSAAEIASKRETLVEVLTVVTPLA
jgi:hypothetical protein